jgi:hypothetical protein
VANRGAATEGRPYKSVYRVSFSEPFPNFFRSREGLQPALERILLDVESKQQPILEAKEMNHDRSGTTDYQLRRRIDADGAQA